MRSKAVKQSKQRCEHSTPSALRSKKSKRLLHLACRLRQACNPLHALLCFTAMLLFFCFASPSAIKTKHGGKTKARLALFLSPKAKQSKKTKAWRCEQE
jgi:hypothetical protein